MTDQQDVNRGKHGNLNFSLTRCSNPKEFNMLSSHFRLRSASLALAAACLAVASAASLVVRAVYDLGHALVATIAPPLKGAPLLLKLASVIQGMKAQAASPKRPVVTARWRVCPSV